MGQRRIFRWRPRWFRRLELRIKTSLAKSSLKRIARNAHLRDRILQQPWARDALQAAIQTSNAEAIAASESAHAEQLARLRDEAAAATEAAYTTRSSREFATCRQPWHWEQHRWQQRPQKRFLFIVGCGHSGTTILHRLLGEHPSIHPIVQESNLFINFTDDQILEQLRQWEQDAEAAGKQVVLEKTPFHLYYFNRINEFVENGTFVSMIRDGRDVVASYMASGRSLEWGVDYWTQCMRYEDELHRTLRQHHQVRLEDLVRDPQTTLKALLHDLELDSSDPVIATMLNYHTTPKAYYHEQIEQPPDALEGENMAKHRTYQVNQPLFSSTGRWRDEIPSEQWQPLTANLQPWLARHRYHDQTETGVRS